MTTEYATTKCYNVVTECYHKMLPCCGKHLCWQSLLNEDWVSTKFEIAVGFKKWTYCGVQVWGACKCGQGFSDEQVFASTRKILFEFHSFLRYIWL